MSVDSDHRMILRKVREEILKIKNKRKRKRFILEDQKYTEFVEQLKINLQRKMHREESKVKMLKLNGMSPRMF